MPSRPQDLVFTLFGEYLLHRQGAVWVGSLLELLRPLGLSGAASRTVLSRMARKGWLDTHRAGRKSYYYLTPRGRRLLEAGEARIYRPPRGQAWDGRWDMVAYSIPEDQRPLRDRLRVRLQWLGFGQLGNGLWVSPHDLAREVEELAASLGVLEHVELFRGHYRGFGTPAGLVSRCWSLPTLDEQYALFFRRWDEAHERVVALGAPDPESAYVQRFWLLHEYREFPLLDPHLPDELLPAGWLGGEAAALFESLHDRLQGPAARFVESVLEIAREGAATRARGD